jgi:hypothetical protein
MVPIFHILTLVRCLQSSLSSGHSWSINCPSLSNGHSPFGVSAFFSLPTFLSVHMLSVQYPRLPGDLYLWRAQYLSLIHYIFTVFSACAVLAVCPVFALS